MEALSPAAASAEAQRRIDTHASLLPTKQHTWLDLKKMGVSTDAGNFRFVEDGTHIWNSFRQHWGWWRTQILGWYPYTDLRDYYRHDVTGEGRPWLRLLPDDWQALIFRELVLLIDAWNVTVGPDARYTYEVNEVEPDWMASWLSLTNEVYRDGLEQIERAAIENTVSVQNAEVAASALVKVYQRSGGTWRPMMPERTEYHRKHLERPAYYRFVRAVE